MKIDRAALVAGLGKITGYQQKEPEAEKAAPPAAKPARRGNKKALLTMHDPAVIRQLKMLAAKEGKTQQKLIAEALNLLFIKYGEQAIA